MSDKSNGKPMASMLYNAVPAVAQLNQVAGFDPRKMLRRTVRPDTNEPVLKLDLRYKRLWFRLACPNGRLHLKPLKISEQMAIFEAKVFLDREDNAPISSFTASCTADHAPGGLYVEAAQEAALNAALSNAGFGIQFEDVSSGTGEEPFGSVIPADVALELKTVPTPPCAAEPVEPPVQEEPAPVTEAPVAPAEPSEQLQEEPQALPDNAIVLEEVRPEPVLRPEMPVQELMQRMTLEQARDLRADVGVCSGWTMQQVAERRPASLKWYVRGYKGGNNLLRAAAQLLLDDMEQAG